MPCHWKGVAASTRRGEQRGQAMLPPSWNPWGARHLAVHTTGERQPCQLPSLGKWGLRYHRPRPDKAPCIPWQGTGPVPNPCCAEDRPGSGPSLVSVAGGRTASCCSRPKVAAVTVGTLLFLTGIGAASWAIGERTCLPPQAPEASLTPRVTTCLLPPLPSPQ